jgi:GT2 family glycosyltransferase
MNPVDIIAILACHNSRVSTILCLEQLDAAAVTVGIKLSAVLVDDGITDGTTAVVSKRFPWVHIAYG